MCLYVRPPNIFQWLFSSPFGRLKTRIGFKAFYRYPDVWNKNQCMFRGLYNGAYTHLGPGTEIKPSQEYETCKKDFLSVAESGGTIEQAGIHGCSTLLAIIDLAIVELYPTVGGNNIVVYMTEFKDALLGLDCQLAGTSTTLLAKVLTLSLAPHSTFVNKSFNIDIHNFDMLKIRGLNTPDKLRAKISLLVRSKFSDVRIHKITIMDSLGVEL
jgi:hypothetical protein